MICYIPLRFIYSNKLLTIIHCVFADMYDCDFENGMCGWTSHSSKWQWVVHSKGDPSQGTGPEKDGSFSPTG